jgi:hypothetical protein
MKRVSAEVAAEIDIDPDAQPDGANPSVIEVDEDFTFAMTDEANWSWGPGSTLAMNGGVGASAGHWQDWGRLEIAGTDLNDVPAGFDDNFDLSILRIDPGAHAYLEDAIDNGNRTTALAGVAPEALYVDVLEFADTAGVLNLNGLNIYYGQLIGDPSQIIDIAVPPAVPGDTNGDGVVDVDDLIAVILGFGPCPAPPAACPADVNGNGTVDVDDLVMVVLNWS